MFGKLNTRRVDEQGSSTYTKAYSHPATTKKSNTSYNGLLPQLVYNREKIQNSISATNKTDDTLITKTLYESLDIPRLKSMDWDTANKHITERISDIIALRKINISATQQKSLVERTYHDLLGLGPLEKLLSHDDISGIIVNSFESIFIEVNGLIEKTNISFRDTAHLITICQRLATRTTMPVDQTNPIWNFRLENGAHVSVLLPPLSFKGPVLTIRKFRKSRLTLRDLVDGGTISPAGARLLAIIAASQCNILIAGGTGTGKTTLLNCLASFIHPSERIITCENLSELQLRQPHVISLETNGTGFEKSDVNMKDLIRNCMLIRPERIIVGEVRGPEAMDLLQAMNTGHDGSMGTLHANTPRDAIARLEAMVTMSATSLPPRIIRQMIVSAVDIVVQTVRMRDGSRKITNITEVLRMDSDVVITQDLMTFEFEGEDAQGRIIGTHKSSGIAKPRFWDRARYFGLTERLSEALVELGAPDFRPLPEKDEPTLS